MADRADMADDAAPTTRRQFLKGTAAAVAAGVAGAARGQGGTERVRVAVVGTGARGSDLIRALTTIEAADIVAICDTYPPHLERGWQYAGGLAKTYADHRALLDEAKPQAVVVAVPLHLHYAICRDAVDAGCDVFCEKTMCYSLDEARRLAAFVEERGVVFQVGLQRRANAIYRQAEAMVRTGMLGSITAVKCQWHRNNNWRRPVPVPRTDPQWSTLERQLNWRLYRESSQGLMAELGSHQLDVVNRLLGTPPKRVLAVGGIDYWRDGREVCDNVFCTYEYELTLRATRRTTADDPTSDSKPYTVRVTYSSLQNNAFEGASELVLGTEGTLFLTQKKGLLYREAAAEPVGWSSEAEKNASVVTSGKTLKLSNDPWAHRGQPFEIDAEGDDTRDELVSFLDHVLARDRATLCPARDGLIDAATVLIANQAIDEGRAVEFPGDLLPS